MQDYFVLFGLSRGFRIDSDELERRYHDLQTKVHPDRHAHLGDAEKRSAIEQATEANAAYKTLKDPLKRAMHLLHLAGHDVAIETNTAMPTDFLMMQMELREAVAEARAARDEAALESLRADLRLRMRAQYGSLGAMLDESKDYTAAVDMVRRLMFEEKLLQEINDAIEALEA